METPPTGALRAHVAQLPDPRREQRRRHTLSDSLVMAGCAVLCGAESLPAREDLGHEREAGLQGFWEVPGGMPQDICTRGWCRLEPVPLQAGVLRGRPAGAEARAGAGGAMDGTALRRACAKGAAQRALPRGRAWASANGVGVGRRTDARNSPALPARPVVRDLWARQGGRVTMDARGGQRASAEKMLDQGAE